MKLKITFLLIAACLFTLISCDGGLFDAVAKSMDSSAVKAPQMGKSLFGDVEPSKPAQGSLFGNVGVNFNQVSEKLKNKSTIKTNTQNQKVGSSLFNTFGSETATENKIQEKIQNMNKVQNKNLNIAKNKVQNKVQMKNTVRNDKSLFGNDSSGAIRKIAVKSKTANKPSPANPSLVEGLMNINNSAVTKPLQNNPLHFNKFDFNDEIKELRYKTAVLIELNSKLTKKINNKRKLNRRNKRLSNDIVSFIQENEGPVSEIKNKMENKKNSLESELSDKESHFKSLYQQANTNFAALQNKLGDLGKLFEAVKTNEKASFDGIKDKLNVSEMKIKDKLDVEHNVNVEGNVFSKNIDLGSFRGDGNSLIFENENTKLIIGNRIIHSQDLLRNLQLIQKFNNKCGNDLSHCKILSRDDLVKRAMKQGKMLEDLKGLRLQLERLSESGKLN
jgi:hypothetical protein